MINILPKKLTDLIPIRAQISSDVYRKGLRACHSAAPLPIPRTARLARPLAAQNLQSTEIRPMTRQAAAMAARTIRSPFGRVLRARLRQAGGSLLNHLCAEASYAIRAASSSVGTRPSGVS